MRRFHYSQGIPLLTEWVLKRTPFFGPKIAWFIAKGYAPHIFQLAFHTLCTDATGELLQHRFLVAGRRGGKTLSAAWDVAYYCIHPDQFHWDAHRKTSDVPLHVWILVPNFKTAGRAAMRTFEAVLRQSGMSQGHGYKWNRGEFFVEFENGSFVEFKTAEAADNLVGAGIDILWIDEAAVITSRDAYDYATPALDDKLGVVIATTTPRGKNWFFDLGWGTQAHEDETIGTVEYTSIHNPFFSKERWLYRKKTYHPLRFKQEFMAAFDSMAGKDLHGDWLLYYEPDDLPLKNPERGVQRDDGSLRIENLDLRFFIGIDPAIGQDSSNDRFALIVIGVSQANEVYMMETWVGRLPFPDQVQLIQKYHLKYRPQTIGIESQAYQAALVQQSQRLSTMPNIIPVWAGTKKTARILGMSPSFKLGQIKIRNEFREFIDEWVDYDSDLKKPKDDMLDAAEIALRTAGVLLPGFIDPEETEKGVDKSVEATVARARPTAYDPLDHLGYDEHLGEM